MNTIINPINNNHYNIDSLKGKELLKSYIKYYFSKTQKGGTISPYQILNFDNLKSERDFIHEYYDEDLNPIYGYITYEYLLPDLLLFGDSKRQEWKLANKLFNVISTDEIRATNKCSNDLLESGISSNLICYELGEFLSYLIDIRNLEFSKNFVNFDESFRSSFKETTNLTKLYEKINESKGLPKKLNKLKKQREFLQKKVNLSKAFKKNHQAKLKKLYFSKLDELNEFIRVKAMKECFEKIKKIIFSEINKKRGKPNFFDELFNILNNPMIYKIILSLVYFNAENNNNILAYKEGLTAKINPEYLFTETCTEENRLFYKQIKKIADLKLQLLVFKNVTIDYVSFSDCGETALRNLMLILLDANESQKINLDNIKILNPSKEVVDFFKKYDTMPKQREYSARVEWAKIVSKKEGIQYKSENGLEIKSYYEVEYRGSNFLILLRDYLFNSGIRQKGGSGADWGADSGDIDISSEDHDIPDPDLIEPSLSESPDIPEPDLIESSLIESSGESSSLVFEDWEDLKKLKHISDIQLSYGHDFEIKIKNEKMVEPYVVTFFDGHYEVLNINSARYDIDYNSVWPINKRKINLLRDLEKSINNSFSIKLRNNEGLNNLLKKLHIDKMDEGIEYAAVFNDRFVNQLLTNFSNLNKLNDLKITGGLLNERNVKLLKLINLKQLTHLDISGNVRLERLPKDLFKLSKLKVLKMNKLSNLKTIPKEIGNLRNLIELDLSFNTNLERLPRELFKLENLEILDLLTCEKLEILPYEIINLRNLKKLFLPKKIIIEPVLEVSGQILRNILQITSNKKLEQIIRNGMRITIMDRLFIHELYPFLKNLKPFDTLDPAKHLKPHTLIDELMSRNKNVYTYKLTKTQHFRGKFTIKFINENIHRFFINIDKLFYM